MADENLFDYRPLFHRPAVPLHLDDSNPVVVVEDAGFKKVNF